MFTISGIHEIVHFLTHLINIVQGGAAGLSKQWSIIQASYSGWIAIAFIPFLARVIISYPYKDSDVTSSLAINPLLLLLVFGLVLENETSHAWLSMSIFVRGSNSVGAHVWRGSGLTDYPRKILLLLLALATFASPTSKIRNILALSGSIVGLLILLCNIGSRGWKKADLEFIDNTHFFTPAVVIAASIFAGLSFPFMGLRSVDGVTVEDNISSEDVEKAIFNPSGKDARKQITVASTAAALGYLLTDIQQVQDVLGLDFPGGVFSVVIGSWIFLSSLCSMVMCRRINFSRSKKIEPFLRRDETSPVGWIVPSIPNIVIDPILSRSKTEMSFWSLGSDLLSSLIVTAMSFLIVWSGVRELRGYDSNLWDF